MTYFKFLQNFFLLIFLGISLCLIHACGGDDENEFQTEVDGGNNSNDSNNNNDKIDNSTLFMRWYLTGTSNYSHDLNWQSNEIVSWGEYMEISENMFLYWENRSNGENVIYKLNGVNTDNYIGSTFEAVNVTNDSDRRWYKIINIKENHLLLYDYSESKHKAFVGTEEKGDRNEGNDESDSDNEEDSVTTEECGHCHGSGDCPRSFCDNGRCTECGGTGYQYYYGAGGKKYKERCDHCSRGRCTFCNGSGECPFCNGKGYIVKH